MIIEMASSPKNRKGNTTTKENNAKKKTTKYLAVGFPTANQTAGNTDQYDPDPRSDVTL